MRTALALAALAAATASTVKIDSSATGRELIGFGGLSGGGATSRLLPSYSQQAQDEIMDYLFKPNFGASLHMLKVEIGGDAQSTDGTEPSHQHTQNDLNCERGYEWLLLKGAKERNPDILTYGLAWAWPAWTGNFTGSPWNTPYIAANYTINWLRCAKNTYGIDIDYIGSWNERSYSADYLIILREQLDAAGFNSTKISAPDSNWGIAGDMLKNQTLMNAVDVIGAHYPGMTSSSDAQETGKLLAASEDDSTFGDNVGTGCWARLLNRNYVQGQMSLTVMWNLLASYYPGLPWMGTSFMWAIQPWSGNYIVKSAIYVTAHWTQFTQPGWTYLKVDSSSGGSGFFGGGGTYNTLVEKTDGTGDLTIVMEKIHHDRSKCVRPDLPEYSVAPENVTFSLSGPAAATVLGKGKLSYWLSVLRYNGEESTLFEQQSDLMVSKGAGGTAEFSVFVPVDGVITLSTISEGPTKGAHPAPPGAAPFPVPYHDDMESYPLHSEPSYFADQAGSWEVLDTGDASHKQAMRQMVPTRPICWAGDLAPVSVFGETTWTDVSHSVDFSIDAESSPGAAASIGARVTGTTRAHGVFVMVSTSGGWALFYDIGKNESVATGSLPVPVKPGEWHTLSLEVKGSQASASLDGHEFLTAYDVSGASAPHGWTAVGTGWGYEYVWFDNYAISSATNAGVTCAPAAAGQTLVLEGASTEHDVNFRFSHSKTTGALSLVSDPKLCVGVTGTDPTSSSPSVGVVACSASDASQKWDLQLNATTTQFVSGYKGQGLCLDVTDAKTNSGAPLELYACNQGENQKFVLDEDGRIINTGYKEPKKAAGPCNAM